MADESARRLTAQTVFIPIGLPCSGKSTLFNHLVTLPGIGDNLSLISPDEIRDEMYPGYDAGLVPFGEIDNSEVFERAYERMRANLIDGWDIWFDATNLTPLSRFLITREVEYVDRYDAAFDGIVIQYIMINLDVPFDEIVSRQKKCRSGHRRPSLETLEKMRDQMAEEDPILLTAIDNIEIWNLRWDENWQIADDESSAICIDMVASVNSSF